MKNYHQHKWILAGLLSIILLAVNAQPLDWNTNGNYISVNEWFGATSTSTIPLEIRHNANQPINIFTNGTLRLQFTTGGAFGAGATQGDGLRIFDPSGGPGNLDLWTSSSQQTHIRWDGSGLIQGRNNRFEMCGFLNGLWFNTQAGRYIFNRDSTEVGRVGANNSWRIGLNPGNVDPARRLEVFDSIRPQFRITRTDGTVFTDFETNGNGNLNIQPSGQRVGINLGNSNPSHTLEVNGNVRFRNITAATSFNSLLIGSTVTGGAGANDVEVRRLAFTGNNTHVLLGNGTWGSVGSLVSANNGLMVSSGVVQLGQTTCSATGAAQLNSHRYIPMNNFNLVFADAGSSQTYSANRIGVGVCNPAAKVDILRPQIGPNETNPLALQVINTDIGSPSAFDGVSTTIRSICNGANRENRAALLEANNGRNNTGIIASANSYSGTSGVNIGGQFGAIDNDVNYAVIAIANNPNPTTVPQVNIGVAAHAEGAQTGNYGIYGSTTGLGSSNNWAGYFNGDVHSTGTVTWISDKKFKNNISDIDGMAALSLISQLSPKTYQYNTTAFPNLALSGGNQMGLIAQDVELVLPELVKEVVSPEIKDANGNVITASETYKSVNYVGLIPLLVGSIKQQQSIIDSLSEVINTRFSALESMLLQCCNAASGANAKVVEAPAVFNNLSIELSSKNVVVLEQNVPNPFAEQTIIDFYLPENIGKAQMLFYNAQGMLIKAMDITERGNSRLTVFASDLSSGVYSYTLVTDGNIAETKRMVKSK